MSYEKRHSGINRGRRKVASGVDTVRGVPQSQIDRLRGTRGQMEEGEQTWEVVRDDYARVGITISEEEAQEIWIAVYDYTDNNFTEMRKARSLELSGRAHKITSDQQALLEQYKLCMEYCRVAPTVELPSGSEVTRGVASYPGDPYIQKLLALKAGQKWGVDNMPTSFTTDISVAEEWASSSRFTTGGIVIHAPAARLKNTIAIRGMSSTASEYEAFLADYDWKIGKINDQRKAGDGHYHIYLE